LSSLVQFTFEKRCLSIPAPYTSAGIGFEDLKKEKEKEKEKEKSQHSGTTCLEQHVYGGVYTGTWKLTFVLFF
jgi:hypothetical protein